MREQLLDGWRLMTVKIGLPSNNRANNGSVISPLKAPEWSHDFLVFHPSKRGVNVVSAC